QLKHIPADRLIEVTYEGFCENPCESLRWISGRISGVDLKENLMAAELKPFKASAKVTLTAAEQQRLLSRLQERRATAQMAQL
ncbi:MAG: hypothetical protein DWI00_10720, partial [Planctomycetota bacterium]